ncbi:6-phosphogluconolactonase [Erythrobacter crassostreae]|uniref:6-phosphogluconolactonase n=1 Tax=Erythrobacter crassostreae TaxID=2828328 RepID=A0A9X1F0G9_9SPHN|nr:6-phosphogluconolactonase [Erythrobacter crassostrea]MBV7258076.1 6-phosphogluconolactonase [Erythrobacter crassostrea]
MEHIDFIPDMDAAEIADRLAAYLEWALDASHADLTIAVPGGSTPFPIFEELVTRELDFTRIVVWPTDDRIVPEDHEASNTGKMRAIFEPVGAQVIGLHEDAEMPDFALVWLGMGADGHIASLFPNTDPQPDDPRAVRRITPDPLPPEAPFDRITLTIPALLNCPSIIFVIRGDDKRAVFDAAAAGNSDLPIARLLTQAKEWEPEAPRITCFT